jgi:hypothetical protein
MKKGSLVRINNKASPMPPMKRIFFDEVDKFTAEDPDIFVYAVPRQRRHTKKRKVIVQC